MTELSDRLSALKADLASTKPESAALIRETMNYIEELEVKVEVRDWKVKELVSALSYYADPVTWLQVPTRSLAAVDRGTKAKQALTNLAEDQDGGA